MKFEFTYRMNGDKRRRREYITAASEVEAKAIFRQLRPAAKYVKVKNE